MIESVGWPGFFLAAPQKMTKLDEIHEALKAGQITKRQHTAMKKHQLKNSSPHITKMLQLMSHTTFAKAHKAAKEAAL